MKKAQLVERVKQLIDNANNVVVLLGVGAIIESGGENLWSSRECYRIEDIYHKTPDEIMDVGFYSARKDMFYEFYKKELVSMEMEPASLYYDLKKLQDAGKISAIITQNTYGLHTMAGLTNVIELHGNVDNNWCPHCGKKFKVDYVKNAKGVPLCDECSTALRPGVRLFGENITNEIMTDAVNACESADLILVLGTNFHDNMVRFCTKSYKGEKTVLITKEEHYLDGNADIVIHDTVCNTMAAIAN